MRYHIPLYYICLLTLNCSSSFAQDSFFPDNYVKGEASIPPQESPTANPNAAPAPELAPETPSEPESSSEPAAEAGVKLSQIGIIINTENASHVQAALNEFYRIIDQHKSIETLFIVLVGDQKTALEAAGPALSQMQLDQEMVKEFTINALLSPIVEGEDQKAREREILDSLSQTMLKDETLARRLKSITKLSIVTKVPDEFKMTYSPGWILDTARGRIMVEGIMKLGTFINEKGEFVESMLKDEQKDEMEKIQ